MNYLEVKITSGVFWSLFFFFLCVFLPFLLILKNFFVSFHKDKLSTSFTKLNNLYYLWPTIIVLYIHILIKSTIYIYIYTQMVGWFGLVWFYGTSTFVGYLMPNPINTYIFNTYNLVWFGLVWFYGISTILSYLMPNPICTCILNIYDL